MIETKKLLRTLAAKATPHKKKLLLTLAASLALCASLFPAPARAQFIGYTFPQTVTQTPATAATCNGTNQTYNISNLGQTVHFATFTVGSGVTTFTAWIQGANGAGQTSIISDIGTFNTSTSSVIVTAVGYYAQVQVVVNCSFASPGTGHYRIDYVGTSASTPSAQGIALTTAVQKTMVQTGDATANYTNEFTPPFGNTSGYVSAQFSGTGPTGSTITLSCVAPSGSTNYSQVWTLATTASVFQTFPVSAQTCGQVEFQYTAGTGGSGSHVNVLVNYNPPGFPQQFSYGLVTSTSVLKTGPGFVHTLTINNIASAGTYAVYDNTACSGTIISNSTLGSAAAAQTIVLDANFQTGLCVTTSGSVSVSYN